MSRTHCERYPNHELKMDELLKELRGFVVHARAGMNHFDPLTHFIADRQTQRV